MLVYQLVSIKDIDGLGDVPLIRSLQELEGEDVADAQPFEFEDDIGEINSHDFRRQPIRHTGIPFFMVYSKALSIRNSTCPPSPLVGAALPARHDHHLIDSSFPVVALHLYIPTIDYKLNIWNSY